MGLSTENKEAFERYYQTKYDFNTASLSDEELDEIRKLVKEKRVDYALAPMGTGVFNWILNQNNNIRFELVSFKSEDIDGMLYIPTTGKERAYIILNSNKPLVNQIYTAAHEFYHYIKDYQRFKEKPYVCNFNMLKDVNEKKACRFAAELLLPKGAIEQDVYTLFKTLGTTTVDKIGFNEFASFIIFLTMKYQMPLKAVIYRLSEEGYIKDIDQYIVNYEFIKKVLQKITICGDQVKELYSTENPYVILYSSTYQDMEKAFLLGNASEAEILEDTDKLGLKKEIIKEFLDESTPDSYDDEDDDDELFSIINKKRR